VPLFSCSVIDVLLLWQQKLYEPNVSPQSVDNRWTKHWCGTNHFFPIFSSLSILFSSPCNHSSLSTKKAWLIVHCVCINPYINRYVPTLHFPMHFCTQKTLGSPLQESRLLWLVYHIINLFFLSTSTSKYEHIKYFYMISIGSCKYSMIGIGKLLITKLTTKPPTFKNLKSCIF